MSKSTGFSHESAYSYTAMTKHVVPSGGLRSIVRSVSEALIHQDEPIWRHFLSHPRAHSSSITLLIFLLSCFVHNNFSFPSQLFASCFHSIMKWSDFLHSLAAPCCDALWFAFFYVHFSLRFFPSRHAFLCNPEKKKRRKNESKQVIYLLKCLQKRTRQSCSNIVIFHFDSNKRYVCTPGTCDLVLTV